MECCLAHCLNIGLIKPNNEILKEFKWEADKVLSPLIRIVELIMNHEIIHEETACIIFKNIIEMLIIKSSPCFQLNLLKLIKHLLIDEFCIHINSDVFSKTIIESKLLYLLLYTIGNSLCPDIKSYCIKIINFMIKKQLIFYENYSSKEISNYLSLILWNLTPNSYKKIKLLLDSSNNTSNSFSANVEDDFRENSKNNDFNLNFKTNSNNLSLKEGSFYKKEIVLKSLKGEKMQSISDTLRESDNYSTNIKIEAKELDPKLLMKSEDFNNNIKDVQLISQPLKQSESLIIEKIKENPLITQFYPKSIFSNIEKIEYNKFSHIKDDSFNDEKIEDMHLIPQSLIKADYFNNEKSSDVSQNIDLDEIQWDYEPLYNSIMEWLLGRKPANLESDLLIDDIDQINNPEILILVLDFYKKSPTCLKAKIIQDFYMLIKWNKKNIQIYLEEREFIAWILDILLEQQSLMKEGERSPFDAAVFFFYYYYYDLFLFQIL